MLKLFTALAALGLTASAAQVQVSTSAELSRAAREAAPGDRIWVLPGEYAGVVIEAHGTREAPIHIFGGGNGPTPIFTGMIYAPNCSWVIFQNLVVESVGGSPFNLLNADDGGDGTPAVGLSFLAVNFYVVQGNGLKMAGVDEFVVRGCTFEGWTETALDLVGCHRGVIEGCHFYSNQKVDHGVQIKGGSSDIVVRRCRFRGQSYRWVNIGGGTDPGLFRPNDARYEASRVTVEDNTILGGDAAIAFDAATDSSAIGNRIGGPERFVFRILNSARYREGFEGCRNGRIEDNRIAYDSSKIESVFNMGLGADWRSFRLARNEWRDVLGIRYPSWRGWLSWLLPSAWDLPAPEKDGRSVNRPE